MFGLSVDLFVQSNCRAAHHDEDENLRTIIKLEKYLGSLELYNIWKLELKYKQLRLLIFTFRRISCTPERHTHYSPPVLFILSSGLIFERRISDFQKRKRHI